MAQKLWEKSVQVNKDIERFTVGRDREMDLYLAKHDVVGSMAHITMLESIGLLTKEELALLLEELKNIYATAEKGEFVIEEGVEVSVGVMGFNFKWQDQNTNQVESGSRRVSSGNFKFDLFSINIGMTFYL